MDILSLINIALKRCEKIIIFLNECRKIENIRKYKNYYSNKEISQPNSLPSNPHSILTISSCFHSFIKCLRFADLKKLFDL